MFNRAAHGAAFAATGVDCPVPVRHAPAEASAQRGAAVSDLKHFRKSGNRFSVKKCDNY